MVKLTVLYNLDRKELCKIEKKKAIKMIRFAAEVSAF